MDEITRAAELVARAGNCIALTGAGMSTESGIPDFRSRGGLWERYDPEIYATIDSFRHNPGRVWEMVFAMMDILLPARPNPGHYALAELESLGALSSIITQNIDNLHQEAGSTNVIEFHGNVAGLECLHCGAGYPVVTYNLAGKKPPLCGACSRILKPTVIFFGEAIPRRALMESGFLAGSADVVLVAGTSATVHPAAGIPSAARGNGARIIEFNIEETALTGSVTDIFIQGKCGETLPRFAALVKELR